MTPLSSKNRFLKNDSAVLKKQVSEINSTFSERNRGLSKTRKVDPNDKTVFSKKIGKLHWKDKKKVIKNIK